MQVELTEGAVLSVVAIVSVELTALFCGVVLSVTDLLLIATQKPPDVAT